MSTQASSLTDSISPRKTKIDLRADQSQKDLIDRAARALGKNRSEFMLESACQKAQEVLLDQVFFTLDEAQYQEFCDRLDAPPVPNPKLEKLLNTPAPWD
ncbi:DUF1778 domain-containing protein [[Limnothrix rosea] IAM M-220]|uniref:type II toxin-antitoxin system TacA family antitoxin n=1 Tax=[Limnothrix rosea] IAM M-220 TaxID=454133 RepID=UPI000964B6F3|nr:DUF1778 domain-containing protein [[Limnothrix rosea] IAM M-220]OKH18473.1 hypothetical protein NIES208_05800 [[Limnothrix rosea] IAM M-220]